MKKILKIPVIRQLKMHCGPACLSMVFSHFWLDYSQKEIVEYFLDLEDLRERGTYRSEMVKIAKDVGLNATNKRQMNIQDITRNLEKDNLIIALGRSTQRASGHYSVINGFEELGKRGHLLHTVDPYGGRQKEIYSNFRGIWGRVKNRKLHYDGIIIGE